MRRRGRGRRGNSAAAKKAEREEESVVEDLLGTKKKEEKKPAPKPASGIKPVAMVKGSFNFGSYAKNFKQGSCTARLTRGSRRRVPGNAVFAKATINVRTNNRRSLRPRMICGPSTPSYG
jgi:hypothetical protein